jgi:hypothetical protein
MYRHAITGAGPAVADRDKPGAFLPGVVSSWVEEALWALTTPCQHEPFVPRRASLYTAGIEEVFSQASRPRSAHFDDPEGLAVEAAHAALRDY